MSDWKEVVTIPMRVAIGIVTGERNKTYGDFYEDMKETAARWSLDLKRKLKEPITASDVPRMLISLKQTREGQSPQLDNCTDICGYAGGRYYCCEREKEDSRALDEKELEME